MKITVTAHIHYFKYRWDDKGEYHLFYVQLDDTDDRVYIGEQQVEIEVPDDFDPRAKQVAALEKKKQEVMANFQNTITEINARISNLQALEYTA